MPPTSAGSQPHARDQSAGHVEGNSRPQTPAQALWRMREYMRPYYFGLFFMILAAVLAVSAEIAIPLITKSVIDRVVVKGVRSELVPLGLAAIALGAIQAGLNFFRRWSISSAVAGMEKTTRDDLYHHLQRLEPAFPDSWASRQPLPRRPNDLSTIPPFPS